MLRIAGFKSLIVFILCLSACLEKEEGCLDPYAINFRASATEACCCEYPRARVIWHKTYLDEPANDSTVFSDINGWQFFVLDLDIIFSEIWLNNTEAESFDVRETLNVFLIDSISVSDLKNDVSRFSWEGEFTTLGNVRFLGTAEKLTFDLGLNSIWNLVNPASLPTAHVLNRPPELFISPEFGYAIIRLEVGTKPGAESGLQIIANNPLVKTTIEIPLILNVPRNTNFDIPLEILLDKLFEDISFLDMSNLQIADLLAHNLKTAIIQHTP